MRQAIGDVLPYAVAVALSPIPIVAIVLVLGTPRARSSGPAFAVGWVVGLTAVSVAVLALSSGADEADSTTSDTVNWVKVALGLLFVAMAARQWRGRPKKGEAPTMPGWMSRIDEVGAGRALGLGLLLSGANPKNLALAAAAGASIAQAGLQRDGDAVAIGVFVLLGSVTVVGSVLFYLLAPRAASGPLDSVKEFMADHNAIIMMVLLLVIGAKLLGDGLGGVG